ncbi:hypothetical protein G6F23_014672 [Rhizopus arrhizus]|nr:hypothetical protein G6F23_014672 [Rhizopus arrhizus]
MAATGTWQLPCSARFIARSASTQARVEASSSPANRAIRRALRPSHSTATAPCAGAGSHCGGCRRATMRWPRPSRSSPATASTMAS